MPDVPDPLTFSGRILHEGEAFGTGFVVHSSGVIATCHHVLRDAVGEGSIDGARLAFELFEPKRSPLTVVGTARFNADADVALLEVEGDLPEGATVAPLVSSEMVAALQQFTTTGAGQPNDEKHSYRYLPATGVMDGLTERDGVQLLKVTGKGILKGTSGAPVVVPDIGGVVGLVSGRYNHDPTKDTWMENASWVARIDALIALDPDRLAAVEPNPKRLLPELYGLRTVSLGAGARSFVGRANELLELHELLSGTPKAAITGVRAAVEGMGGIGKTFLAQEYARRFAPSYPGGIFWLQAVGNESDGAREERALEGLLTEQLATIATQLGVSVPKVTVPILRSEIARKIEQNGKPCLWVVDDLPSGLDSEEIEAWLAPSGRAVSLVTTRSLEYDDILDPYPLDVLSTEDALALLSEHKEPVGGEQQASALEVLERLGHHALAIDVSVPMIKRLRGPDPFSSFLQQLDRDEKDVLDEDVARYRGALPTKHEKSIAATLKRSLEILMSQETEEATDPGMDVLRLASCLASFPLLTPMIQLVLAHTDDLEKLEAALRVAGAVDDLVTLSLARDASQDELELITVHPLVARTVQYHDQRPGRKALLRKSVIKVLIAIFENAQAPEAKPIHALFPLVAALSVEVARHSSDPEEMELIQHLSLMSLNAGISALSYAAMEAEALVRKRLNDFQSAFGERDPKTLRSMNDLAHFLETNQRFPEARELKEKVVAVHREKLREQQRALWTSMDKLANTLEKLGEVSEAKTLREGEMLNLQKVLAEPKIAATKIESAPSTYSLNDIDLHMSVLKLYLEHLGERYPETLRSMNSLARFLESKQRFPEAREWREKVVAVHREKLREQQRALWTSMDKLANTLAAIGERRNYRRREQ